MVSDGELGGDDSPDVMSSSAPVSKSPALTKKKQQPTYKGSSSPRFPRVGLERCPLLLLKVCCQVHRSQERVIQRRVTELGPGRAPRATHLFPLAHSFYRCLCDTPTQRCRSCCLYVLKGPHLSGSWFDICDFVPQYFPNLQGLPKTHAQSRHFDVLPQSHDVILYSLESRRAKGGMGDEFMSWVKWSSVRFSRL